ncbi:Eco29kI family restriction endonuclease [Bremerella sp. P1]|uniref:Eco29kI family restriction endonuclease n=1 Tax=Bremerella sp. P1 TaxID=3026424 RepID=UPI002367BA0A|nr:Eco29kI family restriction endonuclease [Bremerella sp. P1]WDI40217.1 Eco29kI family restriction endonuclease [Bremerella sp. P1]
MSLTELQIVLNQLKVTLADSDGILSDVRRLTDRRKNNLQRQLDDFAAKLRQLSDRIDPTLPPAMVYDLKNPAITGMLIGRALGESEPQPIADVHRFYGSGVYAIYYTGKFAAYQPIKGTTCPIYVGKARPDRDEAVTPKEQGPAVWDRLAKHASNLRKAKHVRIQDFHCRYMVIQSGLQDATEEYLIKHFRPIWNLVVTGFGKHGDRERGELSKWDVLHSGRPWATGQTSRKRKTPASIKVEISKHFQSIAMEPSRSSLLNPE